MIGSAIHHPFGGNAHIISIDLSQLYVAASWVGTVELAIVAAIGLGLARSLAPPQQTTANE
jgi:hypothetical protein